MRALCKVGDIFTIPVGNGNLGTGIVASKWNAELYIVIFDEIFHNQLPPKKIDDLKPFIASSSLDAKIWHEHWEIIGNATDLTRFVQPIYKIEEPIGWVAESFDRKTRFQIDEYIATQLRYRKCVAPVILERALKAHAGCDDWNTNFDELLYTAVLKSRAVVGL